VPEPPRGACPAAFTRQGGQVPCGQSLSLSVSGGHMGVSIYPCSIHGKRIVGRLGAFYPSVVYRGSRRSAKLRVCDPCLDHVFETFGSSWVRVALDEFDEPSALCGSCSEPLSESVEPHAFFATVYRRGQEREDWFSHLCPGCAAGLVDQFSLTE